RQLAQEDAFVVQSPVTILELALALRLKTDDDNLPVEVLRRAQRLHPADFGINEDLGILLIKSKSQDAVSFLRTALARRPDSPGAKLSLGIALQRAGKLAEAETEIRDALRLKPDSALARGYLASVMEDQGNSDSAEAQFKEAIRLNPDVSYVHYWFAEFCERHHRWDESKQAYERAIKIQPDFAPPFQELATLLCIMPRRGAADAARAVELATKATNLQPQSFSAWIALGWAQYRADQWQASVKSLETSNKLDTNPKEGGAEQWLILAMDEWRLGHKSNAHRRYTEATDRIDRQQVVDADAAGDLQAEAADLMGEHISPDLLLRLARRAATEEQWVAAATRCAAAIDVSDDNSNWDSPRKRVCREIAQWDEVFQRVVTLRPKEADLWIGRGDYRVVRGAWASAKDDFAKVIDPPSVQDNSFEYAALQLLMGDPNGYQKFCQKLVSHVGEPMSGEAAFIMARTMAIGAGSAVDPERVIRWAERAVKEDSRSWQLHVLGLALFRAGHFDLAMSRLEESNSGKWATVSKAQNWLVQSMIEGRRGRNDEARRLVDRARQAIHEAEPKKLNEPVRAKVGPTDWVELAVLLREAEAMIKPTSHSQNGVAEKRL
ncbi:MAG TPA: tetratricopeptide repeat protein, partial [Pirellulales bacterium]|nr:tetratricopeptide repeat protein [Pirellulales bacterium]